MKTKENQTVYLEYVDGLLRLYIFARDVSGIVLGKFKVVPCKSLRNKESLCKSIDDLFVEEYCQDLGLNIVLPDTSCAQRYLKFPTVRNDEIETMIKNHCQQFVPYRQEELLFAYSIVQSDMEGYSDIMSLMLLREETQVLFDCLLKKGIVPETLYLKPLAISSFFVQKMKLSDNQETMLLYKDQDRVWAMVFMGDKLALYRSVDYKKGSKDLKSFVFDTLGLYIRSSAAGPVNELFVCGDFDDPKSIVSYLSEQFTMAVSYLDSEDWTRFPNGMKIEQFSKNCVPVFALAQDGLDDNLNFVPEELKEVKSIKRIFKKHFLIFFFWIIFCLLLLLAGAVKGYKLRSAYESLKIEHDSNMEKTKSLSEMRKTLLDSKLLKEELALDVEFYHLLHGSFPRTIEVLELEKNSAENISYRVLARAETREQVYESIDIIKEIGIFSEDSIKINYLTSVEDRGKERFIFELLFTK